MTALPSDLRDWLAANREALNARFHRARRRFNRLDADTTLTLCRALLPRLAGTEAGASDLLMSVYDLILLHEGRGLLAESGALRLLLSDIFPLLRPVLLQRPRTLPGALSNAVENLGPRGDDFVLGLNELAGRITTPEELLGTGALLAWRLGDARLRLAALDAAPRLPAGLALAALGISEQPEADAPALFARLAADAWTVPGRSLPEAADGWRVAGQVGAFAGFGGHFEEPPVLVSAADTMRHRFWVCCGSEVFRLDADAFGWVCRPDPAIEAVKNPLRKPVAGVPENGTSIFAGPDWLAYTRADSFRVTVLIRK
jgi:hypothetical protein